jgi:hypothetical protein
MLGVFANRPGELYLLPDLRPERICVFPPIVQVIAKNPQTQGRKEKSCWQQDKAGGFAKPRQDAEDSGQRERQSYSSRINAYERAESYPRKKSYAHGDDG